VLLIAGGIAEFTNLNTLPFWGDEFVTVKVVGAENQWQDSRLKGSPMSRQQVLDIVCRAPAFDLPAVTARLLHYPQQSPLFYFLAHAWATVYSASFGSIRFLSALFGLAQIPAIYLLGLELFKSRRTGLIAAALLTFSPYHLLWADVARPYSLWAFALILSSYFLLRSLNKGGMWNWSAYACFTAIALNTQVLNVCAVFAFVIFGFIESRGRLSPRFKTLIVASVLSLAALVPWLLAKLGATGTNPGDTWWAASTSSFALSWLHQLCVPFLIPGHWSTLARSIHAPDIYVPVLLEGIALAYVWWRSRKNAAFLVLVGLLNIAPLLVPDLLFGGRRSITNRYLAPLVLAIFLGVAELFAGALGAKRNWLRGCGFVFLSVLLAAEIGSCFNFRWLVHEMRFLRSRETEVAGAKDLLYIVKPVGPKLSVFETVCDAAPESEFLFADEPSQVTIPDGYKTVVLSGWDLQEIADLTARDHLKVAPALMHKRTKVFTVEPTGTLK